MRIFLFIASFLSVMTLVVFFLLSYAETSSYGTRKIEQRFEVLQGENVIDVSKKLESAGLILSRIPFLWHIARIGKTHALVAGTYNLSGTLNITEITRIITTGETISHDIKVTFPEGWGSKKMADKLTANHLPGVDFLLLVQNPKKEWKQKYDFLNDLQSDSSLEGFLFPDTYFFDETSSADVIIEKMLDNFGKKFNTSLRSDILKQNRNLYEIITLASIVENEVKSSSDRKKVADLFLRRIQSGQALQSDATVQYVLGRDKIQHSFEETRTASPYNTYINPGLPPGPIGNPGLSSIEAVIFPEKNPYVYFLSDPKTGETIFSITYEEHIKNKNLHGL